ncbi:OmpA family protein [Hymenobacter tenuis]
MKQTQVHSSHAFFTEDVLARLALDTQESLTAIGKSLTQLVPLVVRALAGRSNGPDGPEAIWRLSREAYGANVLETIFGASHTDWIARGDTIMHGLLGESYHFTGLRVASAAGIREATGHYLLSLTTVVALGIAGEYSQEHGFDAMALARWLQQEEDTIRQLLLVGSAPTAATAGSVVLPEVALGVGTSDSAVGAWAAAGAGRTYTPATPAVAAKSNGLVWQGGLLLLTAVGLGYFFGQGSFFSMDAKAGLATTVQAAPTTAAVPDGESGGRYDATSGNYIYDTGQPIILRLADGTTQKVGATSTENRLYTFLSDPAIEVDSVNRTKGWINFDRVYFETGQTTLTDESFQQLRNVASVLKTFPNSIIKIGGYTDSTGNSLKNFQLSEDRAKTAMLVLATLGVDINRMQAKGYGGKYFVTPNTTPEGRALNRRISIRVVKK